MNLQIESFGDVKVLRVKEGRLVYPAGTNLSAEVSALIDAGSRKLVIDLSEISYIDSPSVGCLADIYRMMSERSGMLKLIGLQERVEKMVSLVGLSTLVEVFREKKNAVESF